MYIIKIEEEKWFNELNKDNVLNLLPYGGILSHISDLVKDKRKEIRDNKIKYYIRILTQLNLKMLIYNIKEDAKNLENYHHENWRIGNQTKRGRFTFFTNNDISIKYLEEAYEKQIKKDYDIFTRNDLVYIMKPNNTINKCEKYPGIVISVEKSYINVILVQAIYKDKNLNTFTPIWDKFKRYYEINQPIKKKVHVSLCKKVGIKTDEIFNNTIKLININNKELIKRKKFWKEKIVPILGKWQEWNALNHVKHIVHRAWYLNYNNIWEGEIPKYYDDYSIYYTFSKYGQIDDLDWHTKSQFIDNWTIISNIIKNN